MIDKFEGKYRFLSNFYPCQIEHNGIIYNSVETYYIAMKVTDMQFINGVYYTAADFRKLVSKMNPSEAKKLGRRVKLRREWDNKKLDFMNWAVREKFKNEKLAELLLLTGNEELIEGNWWHDNFYGSCSCSKCGNKGSNNLGKLLMIVRDEINKI